MRFNSYLGHLIFLVHIILSVLFVYEKTLYSDAANFIFNIVNDESFFIAAGRYSCLPPQFLTLAAVKLSLPLKAVLLVYSLSYVLYYYLLYNIIVYVMKNAEIGLIVAFSLLLCIRHNYFMNHCEMHLAIIYSLLLFAFMEYYYRYKPFAQAFYIFITSLLIALCFFAHPAILLAVIFILLYQAVDKKEMWNFKLYLFVLVCMGLALGKALFTEQNSYEGNLMGQLLNAQQLLSNFTSVYSVTYLGSRFFSLYFFTSLMGLATVYWYLSRKQYLKLLVFGVSALVFLMVSIIIYHEGDAEMMMERAYSMLVVFVMVPFMIEISTVMKYSILVKCFLVLIAFLSFRQIYKTGEFYHRRFEYMASLVNQYNGTGQRKFIIPKTSMDENIVVGRWAFAFETLMYSSLKGPDSGLSIYVAEDPENFEYDQNNPQLFLAVPFWRDWKIKDLNEKYFILPAQQYKMIP